ncbi:MAG TPA: hypothetical protein DEP25_00535, partial [Candidatus Taylorbacteria bacterium]|nr:hypothetical protein [Candidatus Taylorbacteria bacterium]
MVKNIFQDVVTRERKSIRHVPIPRKERESNEQSEDILYEREEFQIEESGSFSWRRILLWGIAGLFFILLIIALLTSFTGATVTVSAKAQTVSVQQEFIASRDDGTKLRFVPLPIDETTETVIPAEIERKVEERATGTIIIYNNFSDKPQRLIKNTRFETKDGFIYRVGNSIIVPGRMRKNGQLVPGSVEAAVVADSPGSEYNISLTDFTIPGFKSDPARFSAFYARSKTSMSGGFDGVVKVPSEETLRLTRASLREIAVRSIREQKLAASPPGYVLFDGAIAISHVSLPPEPKDGNRSLVKERTTGAVFVFKEEDIAREIAKVAIPNFNGTPVDIPNLKGLIFLLKEPQGGAAAEAQTIRFSLQGEARVVWLFNAYKLREALLGKNRDELASVLLNFPSIERAEAVIRPFWSRAFPKNP